MKGDILEYQSEGEGGSDYTWKVEWNDACFCNTPSKKDVCEIIGNIRENPELMELKWLEKKTNEKNTTQSQLA